MLKYLVYIAVAALILWAVWYLVRHIRRQLKGDCGGCGTGCDGNCSGCNGSCTHGTRNT